MSLQKILYQPITNLHANVFARGVEETVGNVEVRGGGERCNMSACAACKTPTRFLCTLFYNAVEKRET